MSVQGPSLGFPRSLRSFGRLTCSQCLPREGRLGSNRLMCIQPAPKMHTLSRLYAHIAAFVTCTCTQLMYTHIANP